jgi:hypothetical protein
MHAASAQRNSQDAWAFTSCPQLLKKGCVSSINMDFITGKAVCLEQKVYARLHAFAANWARVNRQSPPDQFRSMIRIKAVTG